MENTTKKEKLEVAALISELNEDEQENVVSFMAGMIAGRKFAEAAARKMKEEEKRDPA